MTASPIPGSISVALPVGKVARIYDAVQEVTFQPADVEYRASSHPHGVVVSAFAHGPDRTCALLGSDVEWTWAPPIPAWFTEQVARMQAAADYDRREDKRADMQADVAAGLA